MYAVLNFPTQKIFKWRITIWKESAYRKKRYVLNAIRQTIARGDIIHWIRVVSVDKLLEDITTSIVKDHQMKLGIVGT